jgi:DNA-binding response OmpR family regulator
VTDAERIEELEAEVEYLRGELGLSQEAAEVDALVAGCGLTATLARVVLALRQAGRPLSRAALYDTVEHPFCKEDGDWKQIDVWITRIRKALGYEAVRTVNGFGYTLSAEGHAKLSAILDPLKAAA